MISVRRVFLFEHAVSCELRGVYGSSFSLKTLAPLVLGVVTLP